MTTYQERVKNRHVYVLIREGTVLGAFGNLKKLCDSMTTEDFPSYWTLTRKKEDRIDFKAYSIQRVRLY